jgi:uncharacterized coiled-coil protein SlyX
MTKTYTFAQSMEMLNCDPKTFRRWLEKAGIDPELQKSKADERIRYLTQEQLEQLAKDHGRDLRQIIQRQAEPIPPEAYKLLVDRVNGQAEQSRQYQGILQDHEERIDSQEDTLERHDGHLTKQQDQLTEARREIAALQHQLVTTQERLASLSDLLAQLSPILAAQGEQITALTEQLDALKPKPARARPARETPDLPAGTTPARSFAEVHGLTRERIEGMIKRREIATTLIPLGSRTQHQLTPEQQAQAVAYWDEHNITYQRCPDCPHTPSVG